MTPLHRAPRGTSRRAEPAAWVGLGAAAAGIACVATGIAVLTVPHAVATPSPVGVVPLGTPAPTATVVTAAPSPPLSSPVPGTPRRAPRPAVRAAPPDAVRLPWGTTADVVSIGADRRDRLNPPEEARDVGWWRGGAAVGDPAGTVVLAGHVDTAEQGPGAFARLREARPGDVVRVGTKDGREVRYRVTALRTHPRDRDLPAGVFARTVAPRLVLVTCTGDFDPATRHYADTLVVYAVPAA